MNQYSVIYQHEDGEMIIHQGKINKFSLDEAREEAKGLASEGVEEVYIAIICEQVVKTTEYKTIEFCKETVNEYEKQSIDEDKAFNKLRNMIAERKPDRNKDEFEWLLSKIDINKRDLRGDSLIIYAAFWKDYEAAEILVKHKADVNLTGQDGYTAYYYADRLKDTKMISILNKSRKAK